MFFWLLTLAVTVLLTAIGTFTLRRHHDLRSRGRSLSALGAAAVVLYTTIAIWPWRPRGDPSSLFVFAALPLGFVPLTVGAIWCAKLMLTGAEARRPGDWLCMAGGLVLLLGYLLVFLSLGGNFYLLAVIPGTCLFALIMGWIHLVLEREDQRA